MKRYRIKNKFRFITFCVVCILTTVFALNGLLGLVSANSMDEQKYCSVEVKSGDTLWDLARTYGPSNQDVRKTIYEICQINNVSAENLLVGQTLIIPN